MLDFIDLYNDPSFRFNMGLLGAAGTRESGAMAEALAGADKYKLAQQTARLADLGGVLNTRASNREDRAASMAERQQALTEFQALLQAQAQAKEQKRAGDIFNDPNAGAGEEKLKALLAAGYGGSLLSGQPPGQQRPAGLPPEVLFGGAANKPQMQPQALAQPPQAPAGAGGSGIFGMAQPGGTQATAQPPQPPTGPAQADPVNGGMPQGIPLGGAPMGQPQGQAAPQAQAQPQPNRAELDQRLEEMSKMARKTPAQMKAMYYGTGPAQFSAWFNDAVKEAGKTEMTMGNLGDRQVLYDKNNPQGSFSYLQVGESPADKISRENNLATNRTSRANNMETTALGREKLRQEADLERGKMEWDRQQKMPEFISMVEQAKHAGKLDADASYKAIEEAKMFSSTDYLVSRAESLLNQGPTGSRIGQLRDLAGDVIGKTTTSGDLASQLDIVGASMTMNVPRYSGPQSDKDIFAYREAAGQVGNRGLPIDQRLSALREIKAINERQKRYYAENLFQKTQIAPPSMTGQPLRPPSGVTYATGGATAPNVGSAAAAQSGAATPGALPAGMPPALPYAGRTSKGPDGRLYISDGKSWKQK